MTMQKKQIIGRKGYILSFALIILLAVVFVRPVAAHTVWTQIYKKEGGTYRAAVYALGKFVAVGDNGLIANSATGTSWSLQSSPTGENLYALTYGGGLFVAVGYHGVIITSTNGSTWSKRVGYTVAGKSLTSVAYNGSIYAAAGIDGIVRTSTDGKTWTTRGSGTSRDFKGMCAHDGMFLATTSGGFAYRSTNGSSWTSSYVGPETLYSAVYGGGQFVVGGQNGACYTSPDGISWKKQATPSTNYLMEIIYTGSVYIACGNADDQPAIGALILTSPDGKTWTRRKTPDHSTLLGLANSSTKAIAMGARRSVIGSDLDGGSGGGTITVTSPNGGEEWMVGQVYDVTWTSSGVSGKVKAEYSLDGGSSWNVLDDSTTNDGVKPWRMPDNISSSCLVRISDVSYPGVYDVSNRTFSVVSPDFVTITKPNGGETWQGGTTQTITWDSEGDVGNLKIEYSVNNGAGYNTIASTTSNDGSHSWDIPSTVDSTTCIVRISEIDGNANDVSDEVFTVESPSVISLDRTTFNFAYAVGGNVPSAQTLGIINAGGGSLNWDLASDAAWATSSPTLGTGDAYVDISIDPTGLAAGTYTGILTVSDPDSTNKTMTATVNLTVKGSSDDEDPFGDFSTPTEGASPVSGSIPVTGWALDDIELTRVAIFYNEGSYVGDAVFVEGARTDIEAAYPSYPYSSRAGWGYMLLTNSLPDGTYTFYAIAEDNAGHSVKLGESTVTIDNASAVEPFGAIDTPFQGGDADGSRFVNWGWALTPQPNKIPTDGSTITVWVDGVSLGNVYEYNVVNEVVASLFPGYENTDGPTGYLHIDTTAYTNGVHTISWTVSDNAGNTEGIGSRYFNIRNAGGTSGTAAAEEQADTPKRKLNIGRGLYSSVAQIADIPISNASLGVKRGYGTQIEVPSSIDGQTAVVAIKEDQRVELLLNNGSPFFNCTGYMVVGDALRPLPIGSSMDTENGIFYWQAGPGFLGAYEFVFVGTDENGTVLKKTVQLRIDPKN
jgi:hypothetical protein